MSAPSSFYPVFLDLRGRCCVVLGGGALALEKVQGLLGAEAMVRVVAAGLVADLSALVERGAVEWVPRDYRRGDLAGAVLAIDASGEEAINAQSHREARAAGVSWGTNQAHVPRTLPVGEAGHRLRTSHASRVAIKPS